MKIAMITAQLGGGGAEKMVYKLSSGLCQAGVEVTVMAADGEFADRLQTEGVEVVALPLDCKFSWKMSVALGRELAVRQFDLVHVHTVPLAIWVKMLLWRQRRPLPLVLTLHGSPLWKLKLVQPVLRALRLRCCAVSRELAKMLAADHIPNGIDEVTRGAKQALRLGGGSGEPIQAGIVARLVPEKGIDRWLSAVASLKGKGIQVETWILGEGPEYTVLEAFSRKMGLDVHFLGWVADPREIMQQLDLFVLPSRREGEPLALLEAMQFGLPILATRVGGVEDLLADGAGLLTESSMAGLVAGFESFLALLPQERQSFGKRAQERVAGRSWAKCIDDYRVIYRQEIEQHERKRSC